MNSTPRNVVELLAAWHQRLRETQFCQYEASKPLVWANYWLGVPVVILTTFVGTSVFATLEKEVEVGVRIGIGIVSVAAATLASLQTFLRLAERAEKHRSSAARAGSIRREVEQFLATQEGASLAQDRLDKLRDQINKLAEDAPAVSDRIWKRARISQAASDTADTSGQ